MKREFKDLVRFEHYEYLNSEITGDYDKAVTPLVGYYQFMDKYFTPHYLLDIVAARG